MQKFKLATLNVLLYTRSGSKCTYDTLAFSWRFISFALAHVDTCVIEENTGSARASATYDGTTPSTLYSCSPLDTNPDYNVHIIGNYRNINGHTGNTFVSVQVDKKDPRPIILVFSSYEPVNWTLSIPDDIVIDKVVLVSLFLCLFSRNWSYIYYFF